MRGIRAEHERRVREEMYSERLGRKLPDRFFHVFPDSDAADSMGGGRHEACALLFSGGRYGDWRGDVLLFPAGMEAPAGRNGHGLPWDGDPAADYGRHPYGRVS